MTTISTSIPSLGSVPTTSDPATFDSRADTLLGTSLPATITAINTWAGQCNTVAGEVNTNAATATTQAGTATTQAAASASSASASAASAVTAAAVAAGLGGFIGLWASQTGAKTVPCSVSYNGILYYLLSNIADITAKVPGVASEWAAINRQSRATRTSNTMLGLADHGTIVDITSGTFTQTFDAAATLGANWFVYLKNSGTGDVTLDPNAAETIDGLTTFVMYPGEMRIVQSNGTNLITYVLQPFYRRFTSSGTFTKPPGYTAFDGIAWSAGSSGQRTNSAGTLSVGGSGGGAFPFHFLASVFGATETFTIGAGGLAVSTVANGNAGGNTTIGSWLTVFGGPSFTYGGAIGISAAVTGAGGAAFDGGGTSSTPSMTTYGGSCPSNDASAVSASSIYGGAAGGGLNASAVVRAPGTSKFGGNGGAASSASNGTAGTQPGGGGGATQTGTSSGAGADGQITIKGIM